MVLKCSDNVTSNNPVSEVVPVADMEISDEVLNSVCTDVAGEVPGSAGKSDIKIPCEEDENEGELGANGREKEMNLIKNIDDSPGRELSKPSDGTAGKEGAITDDELNKNGDKHLVLEREDDTSSQPQNDRKNGTRVEVECLENVNSVEESGMETEKVDGNPDIKDNELHVTCNKKYTEPANSGGIEPNKTDPTSHESPENNSCSYEEKCKKENKFEMSSDPKPEEPTKMKKCIQGVTVRRSSRNSNNQKSCAEKEDEPDIEEITPVDPLATEDPLSTDKSRVDKKKAIIARKNACVVNDTKCSVEIVTGGKRIEGGKKKRILYFVDPKSILSGQGPIPVSEGNTSPSPLSSLPATSGYCVLSKAIVPLNLQPPPAANHTGPSAAPQILPTLADDMYVFENPSLIVPKVCVKPPIKPFNKYLEQLKKKVGIENISSAASNILLEQEDSNDEEKPEDSNKKRDDKQGDCSKNSSYFDSPLGNFFTSIGINLVQEYIQTDSLRSQKRKQDAKGKQRNVSTQNAINSLEKNVEFHKNINAPFHLEQKKCKYCSFETESSLVLAHHLEVPHVRNDVYVCNFCPLEYNNPYNILFHMEAVHNVRGRLEHAHAWYQCPTCPFEHRQKWKVSQHMLSCAIKHNLDRNQEPPPDWEPPAKHTVLHPATGSVTKGHGRLSNHGSQDKKTLCHPIATAHLRQSFPGSVPLPSGSALPPPPVLFRNTYQMASSQVYQSKNKNPAAGRLELPSRSITSSPQQPSGMALGSAVNYTMHVGHSGHRGLAINQDTIVMCEICGGYINGLEGLRIHLQWIHKVNIHQKMIHSRPPLGCQKCEVRFFTDHGLERHLLCSHGLVTSGMQEAYKKGEDGGHCSLCRIVYQSKLLYHVATDHNMSLKPAHLSYKCMWCRTTFVMYKEFQKHVLSTHKAVGRKKPQVPCPPELEPLRKSLKLSPPLSITPVQGRLHRGPSC